MTFIIARREEIQNGSVQITDLFPHQSQRNLVNDPKPQGPFQVRVPVLGTEFGSIPKLIAKGNERSFDGEGLGLVSYILVHIEDGANGDALTLDQAKGIVSDIISAVRGGTKLEIADLTAIIKAQVNAGSDFDGFGGNSSGEVSHILRILSGESYKVPNGTSIQDAQGNYIPVVGDYFFGNNIRRLVQNDMSWKTSIAQGQLRAFTTVKDPVHGDLFAGVKSTSPMLSIYNSDGSLYS
jgi:hypothetical protein